jgi:hypothetical protein
MHDSEPLIGHLKARPMPGWLSGAIALPIAA